MASQTFHGSAVAIDDAALLILGPSGSGKSALALQLMAFGAGLIADDRVQVFDRDGRPFVSALPQTLPAIEARGVGILRAHLAPAAPLKLVIDIGMSETARLPEQRHMQIAGYDIPCLHNLAQGHFPAAILQYMRSGMHFV